MGVRGGAGAAWAALFRRKGSVACLQVPLELVSGPGTRGWADFCWLDRNFGFPAHFLRPPQSSPILLAEKASRKSITHSLTVHPRAPKKTRAAELQPFHRLPYTPATPAFSWRRRRGR